MQQTEQFSWDINIYYTKKMLKIAHVKSLPNFCDH